MNNSNRLITEPIPKLIRELAIPTSIGFFFNTMYNIVDTWYAQNLGIAGLGALTLSFPVFFIIISLSSGIGTGTTALISYHLGNKDTDGGNKLFTQALTFGLILSFITIILGVLGLNKLLSLLSSDVNVILFGSQYLNIIIFGAPFFIMQSIINSALIARGDTKSYRNTLIIGFLLNLILDPILLFGYLPLYIPPMGIEGIALATVLIQVIATVYLLIKSINSGCFGLVKAHWFKPNRDIVLSIIQQGFPASLSMMTMAIGVLVINLFLNHYGAVDALAAYGVAMRIEQLALLPTIGLNTAVITLVSQNYGAENWDRVKQTYKTALIYGVFIMVVMLPMVLIFSERLLGLFIENKDVIQIGKTYLYIEAITFYAYVLQMNSIALIQGLKRPNFAVWIGLYRQIIAPLLVFYLFGSVFGWGVRGIWWGVMVVTWSAAIITAIYALKVLSKMILKSS